MKTLVEMTQQERAALTQEQVDAVIAAGIPGYPSGRVYQVLS